MERSCSSELQGENVQRSTSNAQRSIADRLVREILAILHKWGIHTLGQLAALDKEDLKCAFGAGGGPLWETPKWEIDSTPQAGPTSESFVESFEFEHEVET